MTADEDTLRDALRRVDDPEAGMNIVDLGLVYGIRCAEGRVEIDVTMTTQACPVTELLVDQVRAAAEDAVPEGTAVQVSLVWEPPWTPERMSELARQHFGWA